MITKIERVVRLSGKHTKSKKKLLTPTLCYLTGEHLEAFRTAPIVLPKYIASLPSNSATSIAHNTTNVTQLNSGA